MGAKKSLGIHWGTFTTPSHAVQTVQELRLARKEMDAKGDWTGEGGLCVSHVGEWLDVSDKQAPQAR